MKQRNLIILIVGLILVGLLLISGMGNLSFNPLNHEESQNIEQPQPIDNNQEIIQNPLENKEPIAEDHPSNTKDVSSNNNANST
ncbi:MAG: hypothetical protein E7Z85_05475 [Methanosphaera stadtmanae]|jgi:hypothetical protein|nr:hypothetical protein [Methanosphaera stadtmanae]